MATKKRKPPAPVRSTPARKKKEVAQAETFIAEALADGAKALAEKPKRKRRKEPWGHITAEQIVEARDVERLSWRDVGVKLELGSPSTARAAYTALTGKPHTESEAIVKRAPKGVGGITGKRSAVISRPTWDKNTTDEELTEAIRGRVIIVKRHATGGEEEIRVTTGTEKAGPKGTWKHMNVLQKGIRVRNVHGRPIPAQFCFTQAETGHARTVAVEDIVAIR